MKTFFITFRSITLAQRAEMALLAEGFRCRMRRTPRWMEERGCGYGVELSASDVEQGMNILRKAGIRYRRSYAMNQDGTLETLYDLS